MSEQPTAIVDLQRTLWITVGQSRKDTNWTPKRVSWERFCGRLREPVVTQETVEDYARMSHDERGRIKDVGGYVGGKLSGGARKGSAVIDRQLIALDADYASAEDVWDSWSLMTDAAAICHSTHSSTPLEPRCRILIPIIRPVTPEEYEPLARALASLIGIELFDDTTYEASRLMYWPSVSRDAHYELRESDGRWLSPEEIFTWVYGDPAGWKDQSKWPVSERRQSAIRKQGEKQGDPLTKPGVVGAFNRAYTISAAIEKYLPDVYTRQCDNRWTYTLGSTVGGAVTYDNDTFIYSHHSTDPVCGRLCNAFDLVRLHLFGEQDRLAEQDDVAGLPSMKAMKELCQKDADVRAQLAEGLTRPADKVFSAMQGGSLERYDGDMSEQGAALEFTDQYCSGLRYSGAFGWMFWDGQRWQLDAKAEAYMLLMQYTDTQYSAARMMMLEAADKAAKDQAKALLQRAMKLRSARGLDSTLRITASIVNVTDPETYDANAWDLNTPDGLVDLRTGAIRPHDPNAKCTKITAVGVKDQSGRDKWDAFVEYLTCGDVSFARYLQVLAGMAAVGEVYEEGLVISYGPGGNGKSTFFGALRQVLGDYAGVVNPEVLTTTNGKIDQNYIVALRGLRLALMGETEEGAWMSASQLKHITSRDAITSRKLYKDLITFTPTHTLIMHTNHLPRLNSLDSGTRRRIAVAPFPATLPPERVITNYERVLVDECGGAILGWIIEGAQRFYHAECKLLKPDTVRKATENYYQDEDWLAQFLEDCCVVDKCGTVSVGDLMRAYQAWCAQLGQYAQKPGVMKQAMEQRGFSYKRSASQRYWEGLRLKDEVEL
jgi:P4 family phage/plasmid primase-like protien